MKLYRLAILSSKSELGVFQGLTPVDAYEQMSREAGYASLDEQAERLGVSRQELLSDLISVEVPDVFLR